MKDERSMMGLCLLLQPMHRISCRLIWNLCIRPLLSKDIWKLLFMSPVARGTYLTGVKCAVIFIVGSALKVFSVTVTANKSKLTSWLGRSSPRHSALRIHRQFLEQVPWSKLSTHHPATSISSTVTVYCTLFACKVVITECQTALLWTLQNHRGRW